VNLYGFVGNDGVNLWDYLGLEWKKGPCSENDCPCPEGEVIVALDGDLASEGEWEYSHLAPTGWHNLLGLRSNNFSWYTSVLNVQLVRIFEKREDDWDCTCECDCPGLAHYKYARPKLNFKATETKYRWSYGWAQ